MATLRDYFGPTGKGGAKGVAGKAAAAKRRIMAHFAAVGEASLAELSKALKISVPTITKLVAELVAEGVAEDRGKVETAGGRRPNVFGLNDYEGDLTFLGIEIGRNRTDLLLSNLRDNLVNYCSIGPQPNGLNGLINAIMVRTKEMIEDTYTSHDGFYGAGVCVAGRVNCSERISYDLFDGVEVALGTAIEARLKIPVVVDSDMRARCLAEQVTTDAGKAREMIYVGLGHTLAAAMVVGGDLYYGHSGLAGELSGVELFDAEVDTSRIVAAARRRDESAIQLIESALDRAGREVAMLVGVLNPELVVVGGELAAAGDLVMLPLQAAVNKYAPPMSYRDAKFRRSRVNGPAGAMGAAIMIKNKIIRP
jgi:predicted NBD/HSP70 family sugar kinase